MSADGWACGSRRARVDARAGRLLILDGTESSSIELVRVGMAALVEARDVGDIPSEDLVAAARELDDIVNELLSDGANHPVVGGR